MTKDERKYLPLLFVKVEVMHNNINQIHLLCIALEFFMLPKSCNSKDKLSIPNREIYELSLYHHTVVPCQNIRHKIFTPHACCLTTNQVNACFGDVNNVEDGLCHIVGDQLIHNCCLNRLFFLDPYVSRVVELLYLKAYEKNPNRKGMQ